jgi:YegS/Rv2252/BmrU family lipid kinase
LLIESSALQAVESRIVLEHLSEWERLMLSVSELEIIINDNSGVAGKEDVLQQLSAAIEANGFKANLQLAKSGDEVIRLAERAVQSGSRIIVAGGGDGTINAVASVLAGTDKILGVLPLGTLNHFAKDLMIPLDLQGAVQTLTQGRVATVDVGKVNDRVFINNSSLGLYPHLVHQRKKQQRKGLSKWAAFLWALLIVLRRYPLMRVRLEVNDQEYIHRTPFVFIGNNEYNFNFFDAGSRGCLDAGQLSLYIAPYTGRLGLLRLGLRAFFGKLNEETDFTILCARELWVETRRKTRVATDGEIFIMDSPLHYRIAPAALRVLVPDSRERENQ